MRLRALYQRLPNSWRGFAESLPFHVLRRQHERAVRRALKSGPPYRPSHQRIIIDITEACNLGCVDCNRSCARNQAPSESHMTLGQVERFVQESRQQGRRWEMIQIEGGEPTLHPQFAETVSILDRYVHEHCPGAALQVNTNGYARSSERVLKQLPRGVSVYNSAKTDRMQSEHLPFNLAPVDSEEYSAADFSQGCYLPALYGLGLTRHGYFPHPICGSIARVFGLDIGRKTLPAASDGLDEQFPQLCRYCGLFPHFNRGVPAGDSGCARPGTMSVSWRRAYERYAVERPVMTDY